MARMTGNVVTLDPSFFQQIREYAEDFKVSSAESHFAIDATMQAYAIACLGFAQKRSRGFLDPQQRNPAAAWKIPVRRITGKYLEGWKVRHAALTVWETYNDSREAFFIEFGINHRGTGVVGPQGTRVRIRRPVLKLSVMDALRLGAETELDWSVFLSHMSTYHSPELGLSEGAIRQTLGAGEGFIYGAAKSGDTTAILYTR